ncbi:hypothetical protein ANO11243_097610 [Dothideomycetidae sp. 11243]|nr:hypothetical protein ANO11243_097610 [fungal sp. No.11243]
MASHQCASPYPSIVWPAGYEPSASHVFAQNTIHINASPATVWALLVDCQAWPSWYKHCSDVSVLRGDRLLGSGSKFRFKTLGYFFEPEVAIYEPTRLLLWVARGPVGTGGAHAWYIEPTDNGCKVVTEEAQQGLLLWFIANRVRKDLLKNHEEWLRALKRLAETESADHGR